MGRINIGHMRAIILFAAQPKAMPASSAFPTASDYLKFYKYLVVLSEEQIIKLRKIALGILSPNAFTEEEINILETKITSYS